jgi:cation:H+ antiporter
MDATGHDVLPAFSNVMLMFVLPLLALTLAVVTIQALRKQGRPAGSVDS